MPRAFLCWTAALSATSWVGIATAEAGAFSAAAALLGAVAAGLLVALATRGLRRPDPRSSVAPILALALLPTILPRIDTTLLSQDASIHLASGRWLAHTGSLAIPDPSLASLSEDERFALFGVASVTPWRLSLARLPGGIVLPDIDETTSYPSFSHLLSVWIALALRVGGEAGLRLLGPLLAFSAWWAIGLVAFEAGGWIAVLGGVPLLAALLPEHWFARFLMPEILAQALLWSGVAAAALATRPAVASARPSYGATAGAVAGAALGVSAFARLEQLAVFLPALLLARAVLPASRRLLPRGALLPFSLATAHAGLHLVLVPTDYANRIFKIAIQAFAAFVVWLGSLSGGNGYVIAFVLHWVVPPIVVGAVVAWLAWTARRNARHPGFFVRANAAVLAGAWLLLVYGRGLPHAFPSLQALRWYVPWAAWGAAVVGAWRGRLEPSALLLALGIEAADQLVSARVTAEQVWASRRLVVVVLPLVALLVGRAVSARGGIAPWRVWAARSLALAALLAGVVGLAPTAGRPFQAGGEALAGEVAAALPADALVVVSHPLDWTHLAAALWLGHGRRTIVVRDRSEARAAMAALLRRARVPLFLLSGAVDAAPPPPREVLPQGFRAREVRRFAWRAEMLEATRGRPPARRISRRTAMALFRLERTEGEAAAQPRDG